MNGKTISEKSSTSATWCLVECASGGARTIPITGSPFTVGRSPDMSFCLPHPSVSKQHAEFSLRDGALWVRDLGSTNGTYVNQRRIAEPIALEPNDLLQLASEVFRVQQAQPAQIMRTIEQPSFALVQSLCQFDRLMSDCAIVPHFQPIVSLADESVVGYELLARSRLEGLESPAAMFAAAEKLDQEVPLSVLMRRAGILAARIMPGQPRIFVNTHAKEAVTPELLASLSEIRQLAPRLPIVVEFHEAAITDERMHGLRERLDLLNMQLAFDDFGAGQARLDDLTRFHPDYVKFDIKLIRRIHLAEPERVRMLQALVEMVRDLGAVPLAEGVEEAQEAQACRALGFTLAQGYYFGRPGPLDASGNVVSAKGGG